MTTFLRRIVPVVAVVSLAPTAPHAGEPLPRTLKYQAGAPIPEGYHLEERSRDGYKAAGFLIIGVGALGFTVGAASQGGGLLGDDLRVAWMVAGGAIALGGVSLLIVGLLPPKKILVRNHGWATIAPMVTRESTGLALVAAF